MRSTVLMLAALSAVAAAQNPITPAVIRVVGHGVARTPPDVATITFGARGEGATSDAAVRAMADKREAIEAALAGKAQVRTGRLTVQAVRDKACDSDDDDGDDKPRLSTGPCAIRGYIATLGLTARIAAVAEAGTLLGVASRLGATDPSLSEFELANPAAAQRAAVADAIRDAREQAGAIAAASGVRLGKLRRVEDQRATDLSANDVVVTGYRAPQERLQPIVVRLAPEPIETRANLTVEFEVGAPTP